MTNSVPSNLSRIRRALELHSGRYTSVAYGEGTGIPTETVRCQACSHRAPCQTERILRGETP